MVVYHGANGLLRFRGNLLLDAEPNHVFHMVWSTKPFGFPKPYGTNTYTRCISTHTWMDKYLLIHRRMLVTVQVLRFVIQADCVVYIFNRNMTTHKDKQKYDVHINFIIPAGLVRRLD